LKRNSFGGVQAGRKMVLAVRKIFESNLTKIICLFPLFFPPEQN
jgi:hypothetical protein